MFVRNNYGVQSRRKESSSPKSNRKNVVYSELNRVNNIIKNEDFIKSIYPEIHASTIIEEKKNITEK